MLSSFIPIINHIVHHYARPKSPSCACFEYHFLDSLSSLFFIIQDSQQKYHFFNVGFPGKVCAHVNTHTYTHIPATVKHFIVLYGLDSIYYYLKFYCQVHTPLDCKPLRARTFSYSSYIPSVWNHAWHMIGVKIIRCIS